MRVSDYLHDDPIAAARAGGLLYRTDAEPGLRRRRQGTGFTYLDAKGRRVRDAETLARIRALAIPPAWEEVWISPWPNGHLQATGRDARRRKQFRYHERWRIARDEWKYARMIPFGRALPLLRERVEADLRRRGLPREKVLAAVVRLLETGLIRVGNEEYAQQNGSYGLTTLENDHADVQGSLVRFSFRGKSGKDHVIDIRDPQLGRIVRQCQDLPGQKLFEYLDARGEVGSISSTDVNDYLRDVTSQPFTAKDFRTWAGTCLMLQALRAGKPQASETGAKRYLNQAIKAVAAQLGNTLAVCRKSYIHPAILRAFGDQSLPRARTARSGLSREESAVLRYLERLSRGPR